MGTVCALSACWVPREPALHSVPLVQGCVGRCVSMGSVDRAVLHSKMCPRERGVCPHPSLISVFDVTAAL